MGFIVTVPTAVPVNGDGTFDQATWGEAGGPFSVPAEEGAGLGAVTFASNTVNYEWQHPARWLRSMMDRTVLSDEALFSSCVVSQGAWNIAGGTLDITLAVTRVVVDANDDGGVVIEITAPVGSGETVSGNRDTYVNLNEAGAYELQAVPNDDPAPVPTAGYVSIWVLVTDGTELTAVNMAEGIAPFPCLGPLVGARAMLIEDLTIVTVAEIPLSDSGTTVPQSTGAIRFNGTFWTVRDALGSHTISEPIRKWSTGFTVNSGTADTSTTLVRRIQPTEQAWFELTFRFENDTADKDISVDINYTSAAGNGSILSTSVYCELADKGYTATFKVDWKPNDDAIATTEDFTFTVNLGTALGLLSADFIALTAQSNFEV